MRLPIIGKSAGDIDYPAARRMVDRAIEAGVNYFDTAWVYHERQSEVFAGRVLSRYPRESYCLATKMPSWEVDSPEGVEALFEEELKKCRVDYFDFYLMHNIGAERYELARKYNVYEILRRKKDEGRIRRLGFSIHDSTGNMARLLDEYEWDFVQIQLNYMDWDVLDAKGQYEILAGRGIPVIVMEPVRGGVLATLTPESAELLRRANPEASPASWAIRYAAGLPGVLTVLSGMSNMEQVEDNIATMTDFTPLSDGEKSILNEAATLYRSAGAIPCTNCRYCMDCPSGVEIPRVFSIFSDYREMESRGFDMSKMVFINEYRSLADSEQAHNCVACGACLEHCPQGIAIPEYMKEIADFVASC
jgi:predicted aldo/keto reductase-like oxidoreductase